jgi:hypothetical protein
VVLAVAMGTSGQESFESGGTLGNGQIGTREIENLPQRARRARDGAEEKKR